jgi:hypothetical protein
LVIVALGNVQEGVSASPLAMAEAEAALGKTITTNSPQRIYLAVLSCRSAGVNKQLF